MTGLLVFIIIAAVGITAVAVHEVRAESRRLHPEQLPAPPYGQNQFAAGCGMAAFTAIVGAQFLVGIPGAMFLELVEMITGTFGWYPVRDLAEGAWPLALFVSFLWPVPIPFASRWFARRNPGARRATRQSFALGVGIAWGTVVTLLFLVMSTL